MTALLAMQAGAHVSLATSAYRLKRLAMAASCACIADYSSEVAQIICNQIRKLSTVGMLFNGSMTYSERISYFVNQTRVFHITLRSSSSSGAIEAGGEGAG